MSTSSEATSGGTPASVVSSLAGRARSDRRRPSPRRSTAAPRAARPRVAVGAALEREQRAIVDLVAHRFELARGAVEVQREPALRLAPAAGRRPPWAARSHGAGLRRAQPLHEQDVLERVTAADVHVLVALTLGTPKAGSERRSRAAGGSAGTSYGPGSPDSGVASSRVAAGVVVSRRDVPARSAVRPRTDAALAALGVRREQASASVAHAQEHEERYSVLCTTPTRLRRLDIICRSSDPPRWGTRRRQDECLSSESRRTLPKGCANVNCSRRFRRARP